MTNRLALTALISAFAVGATAQVAWYGNEGSWTSNLVDPLSWSENFSGFGADQSFVAAPVSIAGGTLAQVGTGISFRNLVDVPLLATSDNNGTAHASMFVNGGGPGETRIDVALNLSAAVSALSFRTWGANTLEGTTVQLFSGGTLLGTRNISNGSNRFTGFVVTGNTVDRIVFVSRTTIAGPGGEGFGLDDIKASAAPVPEPGTLIGVGLALMGLLGGRRRR